MKKYTIGYIEHNQNVYNQCLGPSLENLKGNFNILTTSDKKFPAQNYNDIIDRCETDYLILTHQDVSFSSDLLLNIEKTIKILEKRSLGFSSLGIVGRIYGDNSYNVKWCSTSKLYKYETIDCCFILIDVRQKLKFDDKIFDEFHLYVEDYCINAQEKTGLGCWSIATNSAESKLAPINIKESSYIMHHSATVNIKGTCWGRYLEFKNKLFLKYKTEIKTT
jgi:hypothetical protein